MTTPPVFLSIDEVIEIHRDQIQRYGGDPSIRDMGLLASAVAVPQATFGGQFLLTNLLEMAAALMYSLVQNHAFVDGNKRTGTAAAIVFLVLNNIDVRADDDQLTALAISVAKGEADKAQIVGYFETHIER